MQITRQSAARQEIDTALDLLAQRGSLISAHVLAWAAIDLLRGVAKDIDVSTFGDTIDGLFEHEARNKVWSVLKGAYNFAKHADRDPMRILDGFGEEEVCFALFHAVIDYGNVYRKMTPEMVLYRGWFFAHYPRYEDNENLGAMVSESIDRFGKGASVSVFVTHYDALIKTSRAAFQSALGDDHVGIDLGGARWTALSA